MSQNAGNLAWNRQRIASLTGGAHTIDTGLAQVQQGFANSSVNEPPLGVAGTTPPADGTPPGSRVQVIPLAPLAKWANITVGEPYFDTTSGTVKVVLTNGGSTVTNLNVLFLNPATVIGPGQAATYNP